MARDEKVAVESAFDKDAGHLRMALNIVVRLRSGAELSRKMCIRGYRSNERLSLYTACWDELEGCIKAESECFDLHGGSSRKNRASLITT